MKHGRTTLVGVVDNEADKILAGVRAREIFGVFEVKNEGVDLGKTNADGSKYADQVEEVKQKLAAGEIDVPEEVK